MIQGIVKLISYSRGEVLRLESYFSCHGIFFFNFQNRISSFWEYLFVESAPINININDKCNYISRLKPYTSYQYREKINLCSANQNSSSLPRHSLEFQETIFTQYLPEVPGGAFAQSTSRFLGELP